MKNHIFSVFYRKISNNCFKKRQILGEKEVVGPGGRNNGRLSVWAGFYFFKPRISFDLKTGDLGAPVAEAQQ